MSSSFVEKPSSFVGTYGVSVTEASMIQLIIHPDQTFEYFDQSIPNEPIHRAGSWAAKGDKVILTDNSSDQAFRDVWTFTENGQIAKSRKGLNFYRLCKIEQ
jgi:hypothetical protein